MRKMMDSNFLKGPQSLIPNYITINALYFSSIKNNPNRIKLVD